MVKTKIDGSREVSHPLTRNKAATLDILLRSTLRCIVASVSLVGDGTLDRVTDERLHLRDHGRQRVAVIRLAWHGLHMGDERAALGVR